MKKTSTIPRKRSRGSAANNRSPSSGSSSSNPIVGVVVLVGALLAVMFGMSMGLSLAYSFIQDGKCFILSEISLIVVILMNLTNEYLLSS